ncbi:MAG TPA: hypothetical protein VFV54_01065 [Thermoanaerobaculia bacterium]|nr:hypothetical protein [Thermoanaerobaculia bacterium]
MKPWEQMIVPVGLAVAGLVFLVAAFRPAFAGESLNVVFLLAGGACVVFAIVAWRKSRGASPA